MKWIEWLLVMDKYDKLHKELVLKHRVWSKGRSKQKKNIIHIPDRVRLVVF